MNESNELNDIILNKGGSANGNKKIILAVATLGIILIVVVMLMNSLTSSGTDNLPQTPIPPEPKAKSLDSIQEEALFEDVEVLEEKSDDEDLNAIAARLKEESQAEVTQEEVEVPIVKKTVVKKPVAKVTPTPVKTKPTATSSVAYYIQVGSFSKYAPNKKFLQSITNLGYTYKFHKVTKNSKTLNKVLVGPFNGATSAKNARRILRAKIEPGAFLVKL